MIREVLTTGAMDITGEGFSKRPAMDRLGNIHVSTLVIVGDHDDPGILKAGEYLVAHIPGAEKRVIQDAAHLPSIEKPETFNQAVLDFLKR